MTDKLRILLFDDHPFRSDAMTGVATLGAQGKDPKALMAYTRKLKTTFQLFWLNSPEEMREYYLWIRAISDRHPERLGDIIPELLPFDYALTSTTQRRPAASDRVDSNPLPLLRNLGENLQPTADLSHLQPLPAIGYPTGEDRFGCFAGGLVSLQFADYPCVGIPTTQHRRLQDTEFFEWFLNPAFFNAFDNKSRPKVTWHELLQFGLPKLRERIAQLIRAGRVQLGLRDLLRLTPSTDLNVGDWLDTSVTVLSRYGERRLPLEGLFFDQLYPDDCQTPLTPANCSKAVNSWAADCLKATFERRDALKIKIAEGYRREIERALEVAESFQKAYLTLFPERLRLSEALYGSGAMSKELTLDEQALAKKWGVSINSRSVKDEVTGPKVLPKIKEHAGDPEVARLAALFCCVWLEFRLGVRVGNLICSYIQAIHDCDDAAKTRIIAEMSSPERGDRLRREELQDTLKTIEQILEARPEDLHLLLEYTKAKQEHDESRAAEVRKHFLDPYDARTDLAGLAEDFLVSIDDAVGTHSDETQPLSIAEKVDRLCDIFAPSPRRASVWRHAKPGKTVYESATFGNADAMIGESKIVIAMPRNADQIFQTDGSTETLSAVFERLKAAKGVSAKLLKMSGKRKIRITAKEHAEGDDEAFELHVDGAGSSAIDFRLVNSQRCGEPDEQDVIIPLKRLGGNDDDAKDPNESQWGSLGLNLRDVLNATGGEHGIRRGEGQILQIYAHHIAYDRQNWPEWLINAP